MASLWLIDGFNFLRQSPRYIELEAKNYEKAKLKLIQDLKEFCLFSAEKVICVLDAHGSVQSQVKEVAHGKLTLVYTKAFQTADEYILERCKSLKDAAIVVSSDREVYEGARRAGASTLKSEEFERLLRSMHHPIEREEEGFDPKKGTQKKGPSKRRAKSERKIQGKLDRLF